MNDEALAQGSPFPGPQGLPPGAPDRSLGKQRQLSWVISSKEKEVPRVLELDTVSPPVMLSLSPPPCPPKATVSPTAVGTWGEGTIPLLPIDFYSPSEKTNLFPLYQKAPSHGHLHYSN